MFCSWGSRPGSDTQLLSFFMSSVGCPVTLGACVHLLNEKLWVTYTKFNDHAEDVDKINQICKNLQFQLNKMRSFEEPPFENEANIIVDRWLDVCKK